MMRKVKRNFSPRVVYFVLSSLHLHFLENRESVYDNMVSSSGSLKRHSPTPPKIDNHSKRKKTYHKGKISTYENSI